MKSALVLRHVHFEDLGTLEALLRERGYAVQYCEAALDDLCTLDALAPDLLVALGGPIGACDDAAYPFVANELALIARRLQQRRPMLGICLGAQLMARALGAGVCAMGVKEIGFAPLTLTGAGRRSPLAVLNGIAVLHWHGDRFDIPAGAVHLAATATCPNQAFALGRHGLALQFHLEADAARIEHWLVGHASELAQAGIDPRSLRAQARAAQSGPLADAGRRAIGAWLDGLDTDQALA